MESMKLPKELPTISFSLPDLKPGSSSWVSTCKQVRSALEEYGCFVAVYEKFTPQLMDNIFVHCRDMFELPLETKLKNTSEEPFCGYLGPQPYRPLYESMAIDNVASPQGTQSFRDLLWPNGKTNFCETTDLFAKLIKDLDNTVGKMLFESYGLPQEQYESFASSKKHLLRFNKYSTPEESDTLWLLKHTDLYFMSIAIQHHVGGFEVEAKDGDWIRFPPAPSRVLFFAGDGLQVWSNDRIKACQHRVNNCGDKTRHAMLMFVCNKEVFQVPEELVDDNHPLLYNQFDNLGYARFQTTQKAKKAESPIKAYCGVKN